ncbi:MAG: hypothetical protein N2738_01715 [Thermodesulfovibrionales bacterium]|nr:hypothetical protein [Thermodesulfovibrionales bacterium]
MTAKTKDGKEIFNASKIYTPQSQAKGRGDRMVYGPFRKSGMLADTSLQPGRPQVETFEIKFPYSDVEKEGKKVREVHAKEMDVTVKLWYLPAGGDHRDDKATPINKAKYLMFETSKAVSVR